MTFATRSTDAAPATGPALVVDNVTKTFRVHQERASSLKQFIAAGGRNKYDEFFALRDVSFQADDGDAIGIIGHNGSGKSTLLKCMAKILTPNKGSVAVNRHFAALLELGAGFHPELSGRDNVFLNAAILGMGRKDIAARFDEIVAFSGLEQFIDTPVKTYSSGMYVRLAFAVAINVDPELLLIDEILAVGDVTFQQKCMEKFADFREQNRTLVLVTHDTGSVRNFCDRAIWLDHGVVRADGAPHQVVEQYTEAMLAEADEHGATNNRRGPGPLRVEHAELLVGGQPTDRVRTGDDITIRLAFETDTEVPTPVFAVSIERLGGQVVSAPCNRDVDLIPTTLNGSGTVDISIPSIPLLPGTYVVHSEVTGLHRMHLYDHIQNALQFDVLAGSSNEKDGMVTLSPTFTIDGRGVSPHKFEL